MLDISTDLHEAIKKHGEQSYPNEGCGLLLGHLIEDKNVVKAIFPVENRWPVEAEKRERFQITSEDMMQAEFEAMARDLDIIGVFHSHPDCEPIASPRDLAWATWPGYSYIITEVRQQQATHSRSWQLLADRSGFVEEAINIRHQ